MKILFCTNIYEKAVVGPARFTEMLLKINSQYKGEHEVRILTSDIREESLPAYKMKCNLPRYLRIFDIFIRGFIFYKHLRRIRKEYDFEVVIFGTAMHGIMTKVLWKNKNFQLVGLINDYLFFNRTWKDVFRKKHGHYYYFHGKVEKFAAQQLDLIIACSDYLKNKIIKDYQVSSIKVKRLYHAPVIGQITFSSLRFQDRNSVKILFIKHLYHVGGLHDLAKALQILSNQNFSLTIIGPSDAAKMEILNIFINVKNVSVNFLGQVLPHIVRQEMTQHDILCIPSHFESLGITNMEGLANGISVVTTNEGGILEVMDNGRNGWLCKKSNPTSLKNSLENCLSSTAQERLEISKRARLFVEKKFDQQNILKDLIEILTNQLKTTS
jgi:glycosyltransferase involved in cell wall biosynthesis